MSPKSTVLLVENNPDDARLAELAFERARVPHVLFVVENGLQAMDYVKGRGRFADRSKYPFPKLILLDLGMPGISGFELLKQLRTDAISRHLPVTVLSGSDYLGDVTKAYQLGANSFLLKPSELGKFAAALKEVTEFWLGGKPQTIAPVYLQMPPGPPPPSRVPQVGFDT
jgi:two-component system response regulator